MKKEEFLKRLEEALNKLTEEDRKKVLRKYKATFTRKRKAGKSDEEIILEFGNFNDLVSEILKEHNIDSPAQESAGIITDFFKEFLNVVEDIVKYITEKSPKEIAVLILKIVLTLILISFLKLPILFIRDLGTGILDILFMPLSTVLIFCWRFILELIYIIIAITLFIKIFNTIINPNKKSKAKK